MKRVVLSGILVLCTIVTAASAATRRVPGEYPSIQLGIAAATDGDVVLVAPGVYYETINFGGKDIVVTSTDPDDPRVVGYTIINAEEDGTVVTFENGETPAAVLRGFTITGGFGTLNNTIEGEAGGNIFWGAGIYCYQASPTITKNIIAGNRGPVLLGATAQDTLIGYGGGIGCVESNAIITHNVVRNNVGFVAGGVLIYIGQATVSNNVIYDNSAYIGGGVILIGGALINNTIFANDCSQAMPDGMAGNAYIIFEPQLGNTRIINNIVCNAPGGGGMVMVGDWQGAIIACNDFWNNAPGNYVLLDQQTGATQFDGVYDQTGKRGNISADPVFLNAAFSKDFHLTFGSPCVNAGDAEFAEAAGERDIDGDGRVYAARIDIGADEYVGYVKPVASAGHDRHVLEPFQAVTLDGGESFFYDPCAVRTFQWTQVSGPATVLNDPSAEQPAFTPEAFGEYVFALIVGDGQYDSEPDQVLVLVAANRLPVAHAGSGRAWGVSSRATLDGTASHDPDVVDRLTYQWSQAEGMPVDLQDADTATPSFTVEAEGQYVFELVVSDGFSQSEPSQVRCVVVSVSIDAESLNVAPGQGFGPYYPDVSGMKIIYVIEDTSGLRIAYKDMTAGRIELLPTGGINVQPKIDGDLVVWTGGISSSELTGPVCTSVFFRDLAAGVQQTLRSRSDTSSFSHPAVSGNKAVWVQHLNVDRRVSQQWYNMPYDICGADLSDRTKPAFFTVATNVGRRDPFALSVIVSDFDSVVDICGDIVVWEGQGDIYAADLSDLDHIQVFTVCDDPARQYDPAISGRFVVWTDERNDRGDIYGADLSDLQNIREFEVAKAPGIQQQATMDGPVVIYMDGSLGGTLAMACVTHQYGVLTVDVPNPVLGVTPVLDGSTLVWLGNPYGSVQGLAIDFGYSIFDGRVQNLGSGARYDYIQHAIAGAGDGDEIVAAEGLYEEKVDFRGKAVTVRSADPANPTVVAATVLRSYGSTVTFSKQEGPESVLDGLTITGGNEAVYCRSTAPTVTRCTIAGSLGAGVRLVGQCSLTITRSRIVANGAAGIEMSGPTEGRTVRQNEATIRNCIIAANRGQGIHGGKPTVVNCTIVENSREGIDATSPTAVNSIVYFNNEAGSQIQSTRAEVTYCDVQGGSSGDGNIDADPLFLSPGRWVDAAWVPGDYHLRSRGWRWNSDTGTWVSDDATSPCIDAGDPASDLADEPLTAPQGGAMINSRIDMGAYGGTAEASLAPPNP